jgi:hypothetical protein
MKVFLSMLYILAVLFSGTSSASGEDKSEYDGLNEYCRGVAASLTFLAGLTPSTLLSRTIMLTVSGASEYMADELMSTKCEKNLTEWNDYYKENPIDYNEFVRDACDGNPLTCPGGGTWAVGNPQDCSYYITCMPDNPALGGAFSVNDLIMSVSHFKTSWDDNTWYVDKDGFPSYADGIGSP